MVAEKERGTSVGRRVNSQGPRISGKPMSFEMPNGENLSPQEKAMRPGGIIYQYLHIISELHTDWPYNKSEQTLRAEQDAIGQIIKERGFTVSEESIERAKKRNVYRFKLEEE